jgi:hypothetical protein
MIDEQFRQLLAVQRAQLAMLDAINRNVAELVDKADDCSTHKPGLSFDLEMLIDKAAQQRGIDASAYPSAMNSVFCSTPSLTEA